MISESDVERNPTPALPQLGVQLDGVDEVAVVGQRDLAAVPSSRPSGAPAGSSPRRWSRSSSSARGRSASSPPSARRSCSLKTWLTRPEVALGHDVAAAVGGGDSGGLLAAVLQGVQREVRQPGDVVPGRVEAEDPALVARPVTLVGGHARRLAAGVAVSGSLCSRRTTPRRPGKRVSRSSRRSSVSFAVPDSTWRITPFSRSTRQ